MEINTEVSLKTPSWVVEGKTLPISCCEELCLGMSPKKKHEVCAYVCVCVCECECVHYKYCLSHTHTHTHTQVVVKRNN